MTIGNEFQTELLRYFCTFVLLEDSSKISYDVCIKFVREKKISPKRLLQTTRDTHAFAFDKRIILSKLFA